jgi:hypothetical protein
MTVERRGHGLGAKAIGPNERWPPRASCIRPLSRLLTIAAAATAATLLSLLALVPTTAAVRLAARRVHAIATAQGRPGATSGARWGGRRRRWEIRCAGLGLRIDAPPGKLAKAGSRYRAAMQLGADAAIATYCPVRFRQVFTFSGPITDIGGTGIAAFGACRPFGERRVGTSSRLADKLRAEAGIPAIVVALAGRCCSQGARASASQGEQSTDGPAHQHVQCAAAGAPPSPGFRKVIEPTTIHVSPRELIVNPPTLEDVDPPAVPQMS